MDKIDAIIMAAGYSRRFGEQNKLLANINGTPLAAHVLATVCSVVSIQTVWFVCADKQVAALAAGTRAKVVMNNNPQRGQCESVRLGVLHSKADYYLFCPADQPALDTATVQAVLQARKPGHIMVPAYGGKQGSPALFSAEFRQALLGLPNHVNARSIKQSNPQKIIAVPVSTEGFLKDIDTMPQLESFMANG